MQWIQRIESGFSKKFCLMRNLQTEEFIYQMYFYIIFYKLIEPETDSDNENQEFVDTYDKQVKLINKLQNRTIGS